MGPEPSLTEASEETPRFACFDVRLRKAAKTLGMEVVAVNG